MDLEEGINWYDFQQEGLGNRFLIEANAFIEKLKSNPYALY